MHISGNVFFPAYILIHMENLIIYVNNNIDPYDL